MAERIITIEIGSRITKVCETEYKGQSNVYAFFTFETPEGMLNNQMVKENTQFRALLDEGMQKHRIKTRKVVFAISSVGVGAKEELIPDMKDSRMKEYIKTNMVSFFPVKPEDYQVPFRINGPGPEGKQRVQMYAVAQSLVLSYEALASFCKLTLIDIEFLENGIAQAIRRAYPSGVIVDISVEGQHSAITIVRDGTVALQRNVSYGIEDAVLTLQEKNYFGVDMTYLQVWQQMKANCCMHASFSEISGEERDRMKDDVTEDLRYLVSNVSRILQYYVSQNQGVTFDTVFLTGLGSECAGLDCLLSSEINYDVTGVGAALVTKLAKPLDETIRSLVFASVSAARSPIGISLSAAKKSSQTKGREDLSTARRVFAICLVVSAVLAVVPVVQFVVYTGRAGALEATISSMAEARKINDEYLRTKGKYEELLAIVQMSDAPNDLILQLFDAMEGQIPTETTILEMTANAAGITFRFRAPTKTEAAKTLQAFRQFDCVHAVSSSIVERPDESEGGSYYEFDLTCYYAGTLSPEEYARQELEAQEDNASETVDDAEGEEDL